VVDLTSTFKLDVKLAGAKALPPLRVLFGTSPSALELVRNLQVIAATDLSILLQGEAGTGKELVARWLHSLSPFSRGRFLMVNSWLSGEAQSFPDQPLASLNSSLLAQLEYAKLATLFVENVESLEPWTQASLAKFLQDVGASGGNGDPNWPSVGLRIISTTQKDLKLEIARGTLRPEFFHCISAFTARLPPLRSRLDEISDLASHFVHLHAADLGLSPEPISQHGLQVLRQYHWPGNLRELEEMLISYVLTGSEPLLLEKVSALQRSSQAETELSATAEAPQAGSAAPAGGTQPLDDEAILQALRENGWNRRQTAHRLQISYRSLLYKLKKMDLASGHRRSPI
jgi:two-component system response regulator AtoC